MKTLAFWGIRLASIALVIIFAFAVHRFLDMPNQFPYRMATLAGLYVTLAVSLNLINGITGQFSIGHAAFYMVGAYTAGISAKMFMAQAVAKIPFGTIEVKHGVWLIGMMVVCALAAAVAGLVVGLPSLRLRGDYLAIVTLGFGEILRIVGQNIQFKVGDYEIVAGAYGIQSVPKIKDLWLVIILAALTIALCRNLLKTAHGLPFLAVREDEVAASAMGVDVTRVKVTAFVIGAALAGAAGALFMHFETYASPASFKMEVSFLVLTMVVLGGTGSITGSVVGALLLFGIPEYLRTLQDKSGDSLSMTAGTVFGMILGVIALTWGVKRVVANYHSSHKRFVVAGTAIGSLVLGWLLGQGLNFIPALAAKKWSFTDLRWTILAITLIIVMMLRPQGILAHHEISLDRFFGRKKEALA